jgi:hypothetical protein
MTPVQDRRRSICGLAHLSRTIAIFLATALIGASALPRTGHAGDSASRNSS